MAGTPRDSQQSLREAAGTQVEINVMMGMALPQGAAWKKCEIRNFPEIRLF
jgi:hypothetical protein